MKDFIKKVGEFFKKIFENKKLLKTIFIVVVSVLLCLATCLIIDGSASSANPRCYNVWVLSTFHGSFNKASKPKTYWNVEARQDGNDELVLNYLDFKVDSSTVAGKIKSIYINVSDVKGSALNVTLLNSYSSTYYEGSLSSMNTLSLREFSRKEIFSSKDGWFEVYAEGDYSSTLYAYFAMSFNTSLRVREIALVDKDGNLISFEVTGKNLGDYHFELGEKDDAKNVNDEQDKTNWKLKEEE